MKLKSALTALEFLFTSWLLLFVINYYISKFPIPNEVFLTFILFPSSVLALVVVFSYYVSIKFGKNIFAYGLVLGLAVTLGVFAVRIIPPLLTLGLVIYLGSRLIILTGIRELRHLDAELVADHLVSFQIASLIILILAKDYVQIFENSKISPLLLLIIIVWYLFNLYYNAKELAVAFRKWSRSE